jgi:uncharacterized protein (DUF1800 family)
MKFLTRPLRLAILGSVLVASLSAQRLSNLSTRTQVGTGASAPIIGFVIEAGGSKQVLIRAAGPALSSFGVSGVLADPRLEVFDGQNKSIGVNDNWTATSIGGTGTLTAVGAFPFAANSRDAALLLTLPPGSYTAQVTGLGTTRTGISLLEMYDVSGSSRLINLSTRAMVGTGGGILITGVVVAPGSGNRQLLVRAAGPALSNFGLTNTLADPTISVLNSANVSVATNDNWGSVSAAAISAAAARAGAFAFAQGSRDASLIAELAPGSYSVQVSGVNNTTGLALVELYDLTTDQRPTVAIAASVATTDTLSAPPAVFTVSRTGATGAPLTVYFTTSGSAASGEDYRSLPDSVTIPAGAESATVSVTPVVKDASTGMTPNKSVIVSLANGPAYSVGSSNNATATIFYNPGTLFGSNLRVPTGVAGSTASGSASLQLSSDNSYAVINVSFNGLSSAQTVAYLRVGEPGQVGTDLLRLPNGQISGLQWNISPSGNLSVSEIVTAIREGRVFVAIETANAPTGELRGSFVRTTGSLAFTPPAPPPALSAAALSATDAARFLTQATFGPTSDEITALTGKTAVALDQWITSQMAVPMSSHDAATDADFAAFSKPAGNAQLTQSNRQAAWWKVSVDGPDQLRQRVAFALSQIFVVSENNAVLTNQPSALAFYYDLLAKNAFGNFRTLIEDVTLSPSMGIYLSHLRNPKGTYNAQGVQTSFPDENYAREVMQLFTIGINQLHPDGTLKLDPTGAPIPTYDQKTISEVAKVFTGWSYASTAATPNFTGGAANYLRPMQAYAAFHDMSTKTIVGGRVLPANQTAQKDLADTLDALFQHPNTGVFIGRQLIQRLVTSNPSPGYVYRVGRVFADNGNGIRGDMGAVVRAILMDYEARSPQMIESASFGKLREPVLRTTALLRALGASSNSGRVPYLSGQTDASLAQTPLRAPTVFNFFEPDYFQPGLLASAGLYAPEYQILNDTTAMTVPNFLWNQIYANRAVATDTDNQTVGVRFDAAMLTLANTPTALVDRLSLHLAAGTLPKATTDRIVQAITAMPATNDATRLERVRSAAYLIVSSPAGAIQK